MRLATVVDLMLEEVQQQPVGALPLNARAAVHFDSPVGPTLVERITPCDQSAIDRLLYRHND